MRVRLEAGRGGTLGERNFNGGARDKNTSAGAVFAHFYRRDAEQLKIQKITRT